MSGGHGDQQLAAACRDPGRARGTTVAEGRFDPPTRTPPDLDVVLGHAVHASRASIMVTDAELDFPGPRIVYVNPAFEAMTGYAAADVIGRSPRFLQGPSTARPVLDRLRSQLERGDTFDGEAVNYRADGSPFIMSWRVAPVCDDHDQVTHFVAIQEDVTTARLESIDASILITDLHRLVQPRTGRVVDHLDVASRYRAANDRLPVGGDWHDVVVLPDGRAALVAGDVTGSGAETVVTMSVLRWSMRALLLAGHDVPAVITTMHTIARSERIHASVAVVAVAEDGAVAVSTAGHPPVLVLRADGSAELIGSHHPTLGFPLEELDVVTDATTLHPGDAVIAYTDGVLDGGRIDVDDIVPTITARLRRRGIEGPSDPAAMCRALLVDARGDDDAAVVAARYRTP
jgi:PAS domain S-box-containing protein